ncbi:HEAT repeat domain-containing protein [Myxococcota bacterium]|nr:HEAT repeat domain-containing protein [Myxococcota bacterium]
MMRNDNDPLDHWLYGERARASTTKNLGPVLSKLRARLRLARIQMETDDLISDFDSVYEWYLNFVQQKLGNSFKQRIILETIALVVHPTTIPFWIKLLELKLSRDPFSNTRRTYALAALALLAIRTGEESAWGALKTGLSHSSPETRAMTCRYLARACIESQQPIPEEVVSALTQLATKDRSFAPRFLARRALAELELPVPMDYPSGVYSFKVCHIWEPSVFRIIELRSDQTLSTLHAAIQNAWNWFDDHLYSFYLNGKKYDHRYEFCHSYTEEAADFASNGVIGELGLKVRHKFLYYFDFGANHEFTVVVDAIREEAGPGTFPQVIESVGEAMEQYEY